MSGGQVFIYTRRVQSFRKRKAACGSATKPLCQLNSAHHSSRFARVRKYFAILGGAAIAASAAVVVLTAPAPASPINVCALLPSMDSCQPPDVRRSMFVHKTNPPTITQVAPTPDY
jgi:hypothetical protein